MRRVLHPTLRINHAYDGPPVAAPLLTHAALSTFAGEVDAAVDAAPPIADKDAAPAVLGDEGAVITLNIVQSWAQKQFRASNMLGLLDILAVLLSAGESFKVPAKRYGFVCLVEDCNSALPYMQHVRKLWTGFKADVSDESLRTAVQLVIIAMSQTQYTRVNANAQKLAFDAMVDYPPTAFEGTEDDLVAKMMKCLTHDHDAHGAAVLLQVLRLRYTDGVSETYALEKSKEAKMRGKGCVANGCPLSIWAALKKAFPAAKATIEAYNYMANNANTAWTLFAIDLFRALAAGKSTAQRMFVFDAVVVDAAIAYVKLRADGHLKGVRVPKRVFDKHQNAKVGEQNTMEFFVNVASSMAREWQDAEALDIVARGKAAYLKGGKSTRSQVADVVKMLSGRPSKKIRTRPLTTSPTVLTDVEAPDPLPASLPCGSKPPTVVRKEADGSYVAVKGPLKVCPVFQVGFDAFKTKLGLPSVGMRWEDGAKVLVSPLTVPKHADPPLAMHSNRDGFIMMNGPAWGIPLLGPHLKRGNLLTEPQTLQLMQFMALRRTFGVTDTHTNNFVLDTRGGNVLSIDEMAQADSKFGDNLMTLLCTKPNCRKELAEPFTRQYKTLIKWIEGPLRTALEANKAEWELWNTLDDGVVDRRVEELLTALLALRHRDDDGGVEAAAAGTAKPESVV